MNVYLPCQILVKARSYFLHVHLGVVANLPGPAWSLVKEVLVNSRNSVIGKKWLKRCCNDGMNNHRLIIRKKKAAIPILRGHLRLPMPILFFLAGVFKTSN